MLRRVGLAALAAQLAVLVGISMFCYQRFNLGMDFAIYAQAWSQIGQGNLDPFTTLQAVSFLHINFDLIMWPLAALYPILPDPAALLWIQDLALAGTGLVVVVWITELLERRGVTQRWVRAFAGGALALWLLDPATYAVANQDFHSEPLGALFAVLAGRDLWAGRWGRAWWWVGGCLLCGENGGLYVLGLGLSCVVAGHRTRRRGFVLLAIALAWVALIAALGANAGPRQGYAWLAGRAVLPAGLSAVAALFGGVVHHPLRPLDMVLHKRISIIYGWLRPAGVIGIVQPWGLGVPVVVLGAAALQHNPIFLEITFQNFVVVPFLLFGTVALLSGPFGVRRARRGRWRLGTIVTVLALASVMAVGAGFWAEESYPQTFAAHGITGEVSPAAAHALGQVLHETPAHAEVLAPIALSGRFGTRRYLYLYFLADEVIPVHSSVVVVVVSASYGAPIPPSVAWGAARRLARAGAHTLVRRSGIWALAWRPPPTATVLRMG